MTSAASASPVTQVGLLTFCRELRLSLPSRQQQIGVQRNGRQQRVGHFMLEDHVSSPRRADQDQR